MTLISEDANYQACTSATSTRIYVGSAPALDFSWSHATFQPVDAPAAGHYSNTQTEISQWHYTWDSAVSP